jgi:hypothetical protein
MKQILNIAFACLIAVSTAFAQEFVRNVSKTGTTAATFLEIPIGASAIGMGGAFVSIANDATSLYWNPSGIASMQQSEFIAVHTNWIADTKFDFGGLVLPLGDFGTVGFSFTSLSMADMKVRTVELPEGTGEFFSAGDIAAGISYGRALTDRFKIGFTVKYLQQSIWHESASAFAVDAGTLFKTDLFNGLMIGASLTNFGTSMKLSGRDARYFIRIDGSKTGSSDQIPTEIELDSWDLPLLFQFGVSTNLMKSENTRWTIAADALHPTDNYESMNVGSEFAYQDYLFFRGGYQSLFLDQAEGGFSFGVGLASKTIASTGNVSFTFDYAFRDMGRLQSVHTFSIGVAF